MKRSDLVVGEHYALNRYGSATAKYATLCRAVLRQLPPAPSAPRFEILAQDGTPRRVDGGFEHHDPRRVRSLWADHETAADARRAAQDQSEALRAARRERAAVVIRRLRAFGIAAHEDHDAHAVRIYMNDAERIAEMLEGAQLALDGADFTVSP